MDPREIQSSTCASCGAPLTGPYCSQCGDERFTPEKRTLRYFFRSTVVAEIFDLDGRIWRSLRRLMFCPGFLTSEYAIGRRRPYVSSLRILLITIVVFAVTMTGTNNTFTFPFGDFVVRLNTIPSPMFYGSTIEGALQRSDRYGVIQDMLEAKMGVPVAGLSQDTAEAFKETLVSLSTPLSFAVIIVLGLLLYLLFNRRRPLFVEHLVFAMNYYSFVLITAMLSGAVLAFAPRPTFIVALLAFGLWRFAYLAVAIRRFYLPDTRKLTAWPASMGIALLLQIFNAVCITSIQLACGAMAVWMLAPPDPAI